MSHEWVKAHQDDIKNRTQLSLNERLHMIVDGMAKKVLVAAVVNQELFFIDYPLERIRVEVDGVNVSGSVRMALERHWGENTSKELYHANRMINRNDFDMVWWDGAERVLTGFPKKFRNVVTKQTSKY